MRIDQEVISVLADSRIEENTLFLPEEDGKPIPLDRKLYVKVDKVLKALGGKWTRKIGGHVFEFDPQDIVDQAVTTGEYIDKKKAFQFFETPQHLAEEMVLAAAIHDGSTVLEPSAGHGAIADTILKFAKIAPVCVELDEEKVQVLEGKGYDVWMGDYLKFPDRYDIIIGNPPFTKSQDIDHVTHMIKHANERVIAIMSAGMKWRSDRKAMAFRELLSEHHTVVRDLPPETFKSSGTMVNAVMVIVEMPL